MTIEQKPELNRYIDPTIPLTWVYRKRAIMVMLPVVIFLWVTAFERVLLMVLTSNPLKQDTMWGAFGGLVAGLLFITALIFGGMEWATRLQHHAKRKLQILENRIVITPARTKFIKWKRIVKFQFRPVISAPNLTILEVFAKIQISRPLRWAMVLDNPDQVQELVRQLKGGKLESHLDYEIEMLKEPVEMGPLPPVSVWGGIISVGGVVFLLNGIAMFMAWMSLSGFISPPEPSHAHASSPLSRFVAAHFSSREEYIQFLLTLGVSLSAVGVGLMVWGKRIAKRTIMAGQESGRKFSI